MSSLASPHARLLATAALIALPCDHVLLAQSANNPRFDALVALTEAKMKEYGVPGVALGVIEGGTTTIRGLGITNVEDSIPINAHTIFPIASISKTFAATAMMRLVEQGKVDLRAPVRTYLPDFRVQDDEVSRRVTIWNLLTHTSGWEGQVSGPERGDDTLRQFVSTLGDLMQLAPPGAAWSYNNAGFSVAGGGVGLCMTDLLSYAAFHLGDGSSRTGERVLTRATLESMRTPQLRKQSMDDDIGIAWHLRTVGPVRTAAHGGTLAGHILL